MVSNASDDFPEPDRPVMTTSESRGSSTVTSLRLCSRAPATTMDSWRDITLPSESTARQDGRTERVFASGRSVAALCGRQQPGVLQLGAEVGQERVDAQLLAGHLAEQ